MQKKIKSFQHCNISEVWKDDSNNNSDKSCNEFSQLQSPATLLRLVGAQSCKIDTSNFLFFLFSLMLHNYILAH